MKIGIFTDTYYPIVSGVVTSIQILEDELKKNGHDVFIFSTIKPISQKNNFITFKSYRPIFKKLKQYRFFLFNKNKVNVIKKYRLDIIHLHTEFSIARLAVYASKKLNIPLVYTLHTLYEEYLSYISKIADKYMHDAFFDKLTNVMIKPINKTACIKILPSTKVLKYITKYKIDGKIRIIPTGIDINKFKENKISNIEKKEIKQSLNIDENTFIYGYIGRLSEEKSIDFLINAFSEFIEQKDAVLLIVGDGPIYNKLQNYTKELGIIDKVIFTGFIDNKIIYKYYNLIDVFLNASTSETQGITYIEAISSNTVLLVKNDLCLIDLVVNNETGFLFEDRIDLINKMNYLYKNYEALRKIKSVSNLSINNFSKEKFFENIFNAYNDAVEIYKRRR